MYTVKEHPSITLALRDGPPEPLAALEYIICDCGNEIIKGSGTEIWKLPNGATLCPECIQGSMEEYFSAFKQEA